MLKIGELFTDPHKVQDGVWVEFFQGAKLKIASQDSPRYRALMAKLAKQHKIRLNDDQDEETHELVKDITAEAMARAILIDWQDVSLDGNGNTKYTPEIGKQVLMNSSKVRKFVEEAMEDYSRYKLEVADEAKK